MRLRNKKIYFKRIKLDDLADTLNISPRILRKILLIHNNELKKKKINFIIDNELIINLLFI